MSTGWLCNVDHEKMCNQVGKDLEIKTIANYFNMACIICGKHADYLTVLPRESTKETP
jgi:hypothetical protein